MTHATCVPTLVATCNKDRERLSWRVALPDPVQFQGDMADLISRLQQAVHYYLSREDDGVCLDGIAWTVEPCILCDIDLAKQAA